MVAETLEAVDAPHTPAPRPPGSEGAQRVMVILFMTAAILSSSHAAAFWGTTTSLIVPFALAWLLAWYASKNSQYLAVYSFLPLAFCCTILTFCIFSPLPGAEGDGLPSTDRVNYRLVFGAPDAFFFTEYEIGFRIAVALLRNFIDFQAFLTICAGITVLGYLRMLSSVNKDRYFPVLLCFLLGYFSFWSGVLNITRQFLAGGLIMIGASVLIQNAQTTVRSHVYCFIFGLAAMSVHGSAAIVFLFQILFLIRRRDRVLLAMWAFNLGVFILNYIGFSPLRQITSHISGFSRYDTDQLSAADLSSVLTTGVGTGNRLDWAAFLLAPILLYGVYRMMAKSDRSVEKDPLARVALFYTVLTLPFFTMSYLIYADRLAYYGFLALPLFILVTITTRPMRMYEMPVLLVMAGISISQFAMGWYGYTPLYWSGGMIWTG